ncbi:MAG TPA: terminase small subunit [bacterium]|nr:terminase small subunit [bacterium]
MNARQKKLADFYLSGMLAGEAAIKAGYSKKSADAQASQILKNPKVSEYIKARQEKTAQKVEWTREESARLLANIARLDHANVFNEETGQLLSVHEIETNTRLAIDTIDSTEITSETKDARTVTKLSIRIKPCSRIEAIKELNKMCGFYAPEKHEHNFTLADVMRDALGAKRE